MAEHTPGPWFPHWQGHQEHYEIRDSDEDQDGKLIAESYLQGQNRYGVTEANARLIAAAPDLLAALEGICERAIGNSTGSFTVGVGHIKHARAAIAKAKGK